MFSGEFDITLDDKGRIFLPARHRNSVGDCLYLVRGVDGQINAYPVTAWQSIAEKIAGQNQALRAARDISRLTFSASECPVDRQGRILIPPALRRHAALDCHLVLLGVNDHLEIWSQERWQQVTERLQNEGSDIAEQLADLGLVL